MTLLVISPDYASHLLPLVTLATAWRDAGHRVVVATGPATADIVTAFGFEREPLELGRGSNPGVIRAEEQAAAEEGDSLRGFFAATRVGMLATLRYQAQERLVDLMWQPVQKARAVLDIVDRVDADAILVDHLAFSARLGLDARGVTYADVVLGHPTALPVAGELYGFPDAWPSAFAPDAGELASLRQLCARVSAGFTAEWNSATRELDAAAAQVDDAFAAHAQLVFYNYPAQFADPERKPLLPPHAYLGSAERSEAADAEVDAWLSASDDPFVYVSFGSFLSERADVLGRVMAALASIGVRAAIATGSADRDQLPAVPPGWLVREFLPQVTLLGRAAVAVTHGGNNSVTEAAAAGVPMIVLPFSTDQFAGAAALERTGYGIVLDPNAATTVELAAAIAGVLADEAMSARADELSRELRQETGARRALLAWEAAASTKAAIATGSDAAAR